MPDILIVLVFLAAMFLGGTTYLLGHRRGRAHPVPGAAHGLLVLTGVGLLLHRILTGPENLWFNSALFLFILALIGGGFAWLVRDRGEAPILPLVLLHAVTGVVAFLLLLAGL
ncbi:MAG: hypothetical protein JJT90_09665 [Ectothiorhodospiraceae bacterium]|nr:hypothetical protein [Ectothiorhodospiraceae bacterium]